MQKIEELSSVNNFRHESLKECFNIMMEFTKSLIIEPLNIKFLEPYLPEENKNIDQISNIQAPKNTFAYFNNSQIF